MLVAPMQMTAACTAPNVPAAIVHAAAPDAPNAGPGGVVRVYVDLDDGSRLTNTTVASAPNRDLATLAVVAARRSAFRTALHDCRPVPSRYMMTITFGPAAAGAPGTSDASAATVFAEGSASAPPDFAVAHIEFASHAATAAAAIAQNDALVARFRDALRGLGIDPATVSTGFYDVLPASAYVGPVSGGFFATHELMLDTTIVSLQPLFDAAAQAGASGGAVAYDVLDRKSLHDAAMLAANRDAVLRTDRIVIERHVLRGPLLRSQPTYESSAPLERVVFSPRPVIPPSHPVQQQIRLAVTYALLPE